MEKTDDDGEYIKELYKVLSYSNEQFDKNVLLIASGALGISFAFIEKLVPNIKESVCKGSLIGAWYLFGAVIFISLVSHFISSQSLRWTISHYEDKKADFEKGTKRWNMIIRLCNVLMILGLLWGTLLLINFIKQNI